MPISARTKTELLALVAGIGLWVVGIHVQDGTTAASVGAHATQARDWNGLPHPPSSLLDIVARLPVDWPAVLTDLDSADSLLDEARHDLKIGALFLARDERIKSFGMDRLIQRLGGYDVVLVADNHSFPAIQAAFARLLAKATNVFGQSRTLAMALEAIPRTEQGRLDALGGLPSARRTTGLVDLLRECWPWPLDGYRAWENELSGRLPDIHGIGLDWPRIAFNANVADSERDPARLAPGSEMKVGSLLQAANERAIDVTNDLRVHHGAGLQVWVLIGASHLLEPSKGLLRLFRASGARTCVLVPCEFSWELSAVLRWGEDAIGSCQEVFEDVFRVSALTRAELELRAHAMDQWRERNCGGKRK